MSVDALGRDVISFFSDRASAVTDAARQASTLALGGNLKLLGKTASRTRFVGDQRARQITLELLDVSYQQAQSPAAQTTPQSVPANQIKVIANVRAASKSKPKAAALLGSITLDVTQDADGWAQRLSYRMSSRESQQETALGFSSLQWGLAIGQLDVNCLVALRAAPDEDVKKFFDLLAKAKRTRPLANEYPKALRYHDHFLGKSFLITQNICDLEETADLQGLARLTIRAGILRDYDNPASITISSVSDNNLIAAASQTASQDLGGLLNFG